MEKQIGCDHRAFECIHSVAGGELRQRIGKDSADGLAIVGEVPLQHRLRERSRQLHQVSSCG